MRIHIPQLTRASRCSVAVVGAGPGGVYSAWRLAGGGGDSDDARLDGNQICVFERLRRVGGRILSVRNQGPMNDLTVDLGAYRYPRTPMDVYTEHVYAPLTAALVERALNLPTAPYEPGTNSSMRKIVDGQGQNAGFAAFVERMYNQSVKAGVRYFFGTAVRSIRVPPGGLGSGNPLSLVLKNGTSVRAAHILLNLPMRPLTRLLYNSDPSLFPNGYPSVLTDVRVLNGVKLYVHYSDAWWRNYLNLTFGNFNTDDSGDTHPPLAGRYHDGHTRGAVGESRGFLEAVYKFSDDTYGFYSPFQTSMDEPYVTLERSNPTARDLLDSVHMTLVKYHAEELEKVGMKEKVLSSPPNLGLMSAWGSDAAGFGGAIHHTLLRVPFNTTGRALQPIAGAPIYIANEAYGTITYPNGTTGAGHGWAECSLIMAENIISRIFGVSRPNWINESVYDKFVML